MLRPQVNAGTVAVNSIENKYLGIQIPSAYGEGPSADVVPRGPMESGSNTMQLTHESLIGNTVMREGFNHATAQPIRAECLKAEDGEAASMALSMLIAKTNENSAESKEISQQRCAGLVASTDNMRPVTSSGLVMPRMPLVGPIHSAVAGGATDGAASVPPSVSVGIPADNSQNPIDMATNIQREVLVAPIQDSRCD